MRIIIAGSRTLKDYKLVYKNVIRILKEIEDEKSEQGLKVNPEKIEIVTGLAKGTDKLGEQFALNSKLKHKGFPAQWNILGSVAGFARNEQMANYASLDEDNDGILIAFWDGKSSGTGNMISLANKYKLKVYIIEFEPNIEEDQ